MSEDPHAILARILGRAKGFGHREHLELVWNLLEHLPPRSAAVEAERLLRQIAESHGTPERFHATLTQAWVRVVARHRELEAGGSFEEFLALHPLLLDQGIISRHYGAERLFGDEARRGWVEPDVRPLPALAA